MDALVEMQTDYYEYLKSHGFKSVLLDEPALLIGSRFKPDNSLQTEMPYLMTWFKNHDIHWTEVDEVDVGCDMLPSNLVEDFLKNNKQEFWKRNLAIEKAIRNYADENHLSGVLTLDAPIPHEKVISQAKSNELWLELCLQMNQIILADPNIVIHWVVFAFAPVALTSPSVEGIKTAGMDVIIMKMVAYLAFMYTDIEDVFILNQYQYDVCRAVFSDLLLAALGIDVVNQVKAQFA
jgi:hypothetical protein